MTKKFINNLKLELVHVALRRAVSQKPKLMLSFFRTRG